MKRTLLLAALAASISANASTRDSYFGFGVALPLHASARLDDWHNDASTRIGARIVLGKHFNNWLTFECEAYQSRVRIVGASAHDKTGALSTGLLANAIVRKETKSGYVYAGVGAGVARNRSYDYERALLTTPISLDTSLSGLVRNRLAMQFKAGIAQDLTKRLSVSVELSHIRCGSFSYLDTSVAPQLIKFKCAFTTINILIRFKV